MNSFSRLVLALLAIVGIPIAGLAQLSYTTSFKAATANAPDGIVAADFNRDGRPDFAALESPNVAVYLNTGSGHFSSAILSSVPADAFLIQAADFNRDGKIDIVFAESQTGRLGVMLGTGSGTFGSPKYLSVTNYPVAMALGDLNNDGSVDIAVESCTTAIPGTCSLDIFLGNGSGGFTLANAFEVPSGASSRNNLVLADFNKDGKLDLATAAMAPSRALVYFGQGNGAFSGPLTLAVHNPIPANSVEAQPNLVSADFNGDAIPDLVVMAGYICGGSACGGANLTSFLSNGSGGFTQKAYYTVSNNFGPESMRAADLNNNLRQDLMIWNGSARDGGYDDWLGNGDGTFYNSGGLGGAFSDIQIRDMNLDGRHDMIWGDYLFDSVYVQLSNNGTDYCTPPPSDAIRARICSPGSTASSNLVTFLASGNSPVGIQRLEIWVDGVKRYQILNDQLRKTLSLTTGTHTITVVSVDKLTGYSKTTKTLTVQ